MKKYGAASRSRARFAALLPCQNCQLGTTAATFVCILQCAATRYLQKLHAWIHPSVKAAHRQRGLHTLQVHQTFSKSHFNMMQKKKNCDDVVLKRRVAHMGAPYCSTAGATSLPRCPCLPRPTARFASPENKKVSAQTWLQLASRGRKSAAVTEVFLDRVLSLS